MVSGSKKVVYAALFGNLAIALFKLAAALVGKSSAMLAEAYHSFSDTINQVLLLVGIARSARRPDQRHPFGYGKVQFFYAFVVAMLIFGVAGVLSIREGIHKLLHPVPVESLLLIYLSLAVSFVVEFFALRTAYKKLQEEMKEEKIESIIRAIRESKDPTVLAVFVEDSLALFSLFVAGLSVSLSYFLKNPLLDAWGSLIIGATLMIVAILLGYETKKLLIGEAVSGNKQKKLLEAISKVKGVGEVLDLRTMHLGPEQVIIATDVHIKDKRRVEKIIGEVKKNMRQVFPKSHCYVEAESLVHCHKK